MNTKGIITAIVTIAIGVILTTGVLIPVIGDATSTGGGTGGNYTNTGDYRYTPITQDTNKVIKLERVDNVFNISLNDTVAYTIPVTEDMNVFVPLLVAMTEGTGIEFIGVLFNSHTYENNVVEFFDLYPGENYSVTSIMTDPCVFTITDGSVEYEIGDFYPYNQTFIYSIDPSGDYIYSSNPVVASDSEIYFIDCYQTTGYEDAANQSNYMRFFFGSGNINDLQIEGDNEIVSDDIATSDYGSAKKIDSVSITWSPDPELENVSATFNKFIVPIEVAGAGGSSDGMSPTLSAMLSVIPLIVIVGLIVGTVGYFLRKQ